MPDPLTLRPKERAMVFQERAMEAMMEAMSNHPLEGAQEAIVYALLALEARLEEVADSIG